MPEIKFFNNKILFDSSAVAFHDNCCCNDYYQYRFCENALPAFIAPDLGEWLMACLATPTGIPVTDTFNAAVATDSHAVNDTNWIARYGYYAGSGLEITALGLEFTLTSPGSILVDHVFDIMKYINATGETVQYDYDFDFVSRVGHSSSRIVFAGVGWPGFSRFSGVQDRTASSWGPSDAYAVALDNNWLQGGIAPRLGVDGYPIFRQGIDVYSTGVSSEMDMTDVLTTGTQGFVGSQSHGQTADGTIFGRFYSHMPPGTSGTVKGILAQLRCRRGSDSAHITLDQGTEELMHKVYRAEAVGGPVTDPEPSYVVDLDATSCADIDVVEQGSGCDVVVTTLTLCDDTGGDLYLGPADVPLSDYVFADPGTGVDLYKSMGTGAGAATDPVPCVVDPAALTVPVSTRIIPLGCEDVTASAYGDNFSDSLDLCKFFEGNVRGTNVVTGGFLVQTTDSSGSATNASLLSHGFTTFGSRWTLTLLCDVTEWGGGTSQKWVRLHVITGGTDRIIGRYRDISGAGVDGWQAHDSAQVGSVTAYTGNQANLRIISDGADITVQYSENGGSSWSTQHTWVGAGGEPTFVRIQTTMIVPSAPAMISKSTDFIISDALAPCLPVGDDFSGIDPNSATVGGPYWSDRMALSGTSGTGAINIVSSQCLLTNTGGLSSFINVATMQTADFSAAVGSADFTEEMKFTRSYSGSTAGFLIYPRFHGLGTTFLEFDYANTQNLRFFWNGALDSTIQSLAATPTVLTITVQRIGTAWTLKLNGVTKVTKVIGVGVAVGSAFRLQANQLNNANTGTQTLATDYITATNDGGQLLICT